MSPWKFLFSAFCLVSSAVHAGHTGHSECNVKAAGDIINATCIYKGNVSFIEITMCKNTSTNTCDTMCTCRLGFGDKNVCPCKDGWEAKYIRADSAQDLEIMIFRSEAVQGTMYCQSADIDSVQDIGQCFLNSAVLGQNPPTTVLPLQSPKPTAPNQTLPPTTVLPLPSPKPTAPREDKIGPGGIAEIVIAVVVVVVVVVAALVGYICVRHKRKKGENGDAVMKLNDLEGGRGQW